MVGVDHFLKHFLPSLSTVRERDRRLQQSCPGTQTENISVIYIFLFIFLFFILPGFHTEIKILIIRETWLR